MDEQVSANDFAEQAGFESALKDAAITFDTSVDVEKWYLIKDHSIYAIVTVKAQETCYRVTTTIWSKYLSHAEIHLAVNAWLTDYLVRTIAVPHGMFRLRRLKSRFVEGLYTGHTIEEILEENPQYITDTFILGDGMYTLDEEATQAFLEAIEER